jgi:hypothetical protein
MPLWRSTLASVARDNCGHSLSSRDRGIGIPGEYVHGAPASSSSVDAPGPGPLRIPSGLRDAVPYHVVGQYLPERGRGGDPRELPLPVIARIRELRAERDAAGGHACTRQQLADMFEVRQATIVRHCADLGFHGAAGNDAIPGTARRRRREPCHDPASRGHVRRAGWGRQPLVQLDQGAAQFGISVSDVRRALRSRRGGGVPARALRGSAVAGDLPRAAGAPEGPRPRPARCWPLRRPSRQQGRGGTAEPTSSTAGRLSAAPSGMLPAARPTAVGRAICPAYPRVVTRARVRGGLGAWQRA